MATIARNIIFKPTEIVNYKSSNGRCRQSQDYIKFNGDFNGTRRVVSSITISSQDLSAYLNTDSNPSTPYVPLYPGSPTTKQYVDQHDTIVSATAPSNPTEGMVWYDTANDSLKAYNGTSWETEGTKMVVLEYGVSTWQDFLDAYNKNAVVYCKVSSGSSGYRMAFMAYTAGSSTPTEVEFQYYRSRSSHSTAANQLDEVYVYKLTNAGVWTTTQRDTAAKAIAGTGIGLTFNSSGMTISADTSVLATKTDLNSKQDTLVSGTNIKTVNSNSLLGSGDVTLNDVKSSATAPSNPTEGMLWYDTTNDVLKAYNGTQWNAVDTNTTYNAGEGIEIGTYNDYSAMRGPCPRGFHVPSKDEWVALREVLTSTFGMASNATTMGTYLKMPPAGYRDYSSSSTGQQGGHGGYWSCTPYSSNPSNYASYLFFSSSVINPQNYDRYAYGYSVRGFKDSPVIPDSDWTTLYQGTGSAGIFWDSSLGLISVSGDGTTWYTIQDKNLGATTVYNQGDALTGDNGGKYFQRGNNYGFAWTGSITTSSTKVNASDYGPNTGNGYYSSDTFITGSSNWSSVRNDNLWGATTGVVTLDNAISNTGVLSVNGKTGYVAVKEYNAGEGIKIGTYNDYSVMRGPCPKGFHIPNDADVNLLISIKNTLSIDGTYFKLPVAGYINTSGQFFSSGNQYWKCTQVGSTSNNFYTFDATLGKGGYQQTYGMAIRPFKDTPVIPDNSWTTLYDGSSVATGAGVFHNVILGLISASKDGTNWITISDKNLGATAVYNNGDTLTDANCGGLFQGGNNYMFGRANVTNTSSTQVDASNYGPGNYYYSSTFITGNRWDSSYNTNLRGGVTGVVTLNNAISNTGVLSVNGQTGDITIPTAEESNTKTFYLSSTSDLTNAQAAYDWYLAGKNPIIIYNDKSYIIYSKAGSYIYFANSSITSSIYQNSVTQIKKNRISFTLSGSTVTAINLNNDYPVTSYLSTATDYSTPYTPQYDGSPATKKYVDDNVVQKGSTAPLSPTEGMVWYDTTNDQLKVYDGTNRNVTGKEYTAGDGIEIEQDTIKVRTGEFLGIQNGTDYSAMRGPCEEGFHIPTNDERQEIIDVGILIGAFSGSDSTNVISYLKLPLGGRIQNNQPARGEYGTKGYYRTCKSYSTNNAYVLKITSSSGPSVDSAIKTWGYNIRAKKDVAVAKTSSWTTLYDGSSYASGAGIFWNETSGLISISKGGGNRITISDKNVGAKTAYDGVDELSYDNCGKYFQWGNNYGFPYRRTGILYKSNDSIKDVSAYGPKNYYESSFFVARNGTWENNPDLWGGETGVLTTGDLNNTGYPKIQEYINDILDIKFSFKPNRGPCREGFHIPFAGERDLIKAAYQTLMGYSGITMTNFGTYMKLPAFTGRLMYTTGTVDLSQYGMYRSINLYSGTGHYIVQLYNNGSAYTTNNNSPASAVAIRAFKDNSEVPDSTWTTLYDGSSIATNAGIFWNKEKGLISISSDGINWKTIEDKNVGATKCLGDPASDAEETMGLLYQRGNNYGFKVGAYKKISTTQVDTSEYSWENPYYSDVFIQGNYDRSTASNFNDLRGYYTCGIKDKTDNCVTSVNGKKGDLTIPEKREGSGIAFITDNSIKRGPCPEGFHVPSRDEIYFMDSFIKKFNLTPTEFSRSCKIPGGSSGGINFSRLSRSSGHGANDTNGCAWTAEGYKITYYGSSIIYGNFSAQDCTEGNPIRAVRNIPVEANNTWTILYDGSSVTPGAGIFYNSTSGLISITPDGEKWITIADKNVGATKVWNYGDTFDADNSGLFFQFGNTYGFPKSGATSTSSDQVDISGYGPNNLYNSSTFITNNSSRRTSPNWNIWGGYEGKPDTIANTGVLSVNGQTGNVVVGEPTVVSGDTGVTYTIKVSNSDPASGTASNIITLVP